MRALACGVLLSSSFNTREDPDSDQHEGAHHDPVNRYMHQACTVDEPGNYDDKTGQVNSE
jgi:hypothetical protein